MVIKKPSSRAAYWAALFCFVGIGLIAASHLNRPNHAAQPANVREHLTIETRSGPKTFQIEVARTVEQQALGLMFRTTLPDTDGMLFRHEEAREVTMWMRNTYIPLDMIFIRTDGIVHRIEANTEPMSERVISSNGPVGAVLEIAGGAAARLGIAAGDRVGHGAFQQSPDRQ